MFHSEKLKIKEKENIVNEKISIKDKLIGCCEKVKKFINKVDEIMLFKTKNNSLNGLIYV